MRKLITWLYKRYGEPELLDITRFRYGITGTLPVDLNGNIDVFEMEESKRADFLRWAYDVFSNPYFPLVIDSLLKVQGDEMIAKAITEKQLLCGRSSRHGVNIVLEQYKYLADKYLALTTPVKETINKYDIL